MSAFPVTIYHNPACGTSRNALDLIRRAGIEPTVVEYLQTPYTEAQLRALLDAMGIPVRELLRFKGTPAAEMGLDNPAVSDDELLRHMVAQPLLVNRPIVITLRGTRLCRPSDTVRELLPPA